MARPEEEVWAVVGDGGFQMTMMELATAVQERVAVRVAIINNGYLGMVRQWQEFFYEERYYATPMVNPDFCKIAEAYGIPSRRVTARDAYGTPLLVRPIDGWAARGVVRIGPDVDPAWAFHVATTASPTGQVMCEPFLPGRSLVAVAVVVATEAVVVDVSECAHEARFAPFVIASGSRAPCDLTAAQRARIDTLVGRVVAALGVRDVLCTVELVAGEDEAVVVDVQVGLTNGRRLAHDIPLAAGIHPVEAAVRVALADPPEPALLRPRWCRPVVEIALFPTPGTVVGVHDTAEAAAADGVTLVDVSAALGSRVCPPTSNLCRGGVVVATGLSAEAALASARAAAARIRIVTEGDPSPRDPRLN
jgi:hypothetical protein